MNKIFTGTFLIILVSVSACKLHKKVAVQSSKTTFQDSIIAIQEPNKNINKLPAIKDTLLKEPQIALPNLALQSFLDSLCQIKLNYKTFSGKAKIQYNGPGDEQQEFSANVRIRKDSLIWISVSALGGLVQGARVMVRTDSIFLINYIQKEVFRLPLKDIGKILPTGIDYHSLQNLITGEPMRNGKIVDVNDTNRYWTLIMQDSAYLQNIAFNKSDTSLQAEKLETIKPNGPSAEMILSNYELSPFGKFSNTRSINVTNNHENYYLDVKFLNSNFNQQLEYPFNIPKNYTEK